LQLFIGDSGGKPDAWKRELEREQAQRIFPPEMLEL